MNTSKYTAAERKTIKRDQRTPAYRQLQQQSTAQRAELEAKLAKRAAPYEEKLKDRDAIIARLREKLIEAGVDKDEVAKLAA